MRKHPIKISIVALIILLSGIGFGVHLFISKEAPEIADQATERSAVGSAADPENKVAENSVEKSNKMTLTAVDESGRSVAPNRLLKSKLLYVNATNSEEATSQYQLITSEQMPSPAQWAEVETYDFHKDLYFYREPETQWIQIILSNGRSTSTRIYGLKGGLLDAPPDSPLTGKEYIEGMGIGFIVSARPHHTIFPEIDVVELKKAGFSHVRMHVTRGIGETPETPGYFKNLDRWITQMTRHGLFCHIGNSMGTTVEKANIQDRARTDLEIAYEQELFSWWQTIAERYKGRSHRLAYHIFLETEVGSAEWLNSHYAEVTRLVRQIEPSRVLIYGPPGMNDSARLKNMTFPYPDSGDYFFSDFHLFFLGNGWMHPEDIRYKKERLEAVVEWMEQRDIPLLLSACHAAASIWNPNNQEYLSHRINYVENLYRQLDKAKYPIPVTWLTIGQYFEQGKGWIPSRRVMTEAINRDATIDPNDPDGDLIPTEEEISKYNTNPLKADSDQDNILDTWEVRLPSLNPNDPSDGHVIGDLGSNADFDGDGMGNAWELDYYVSYLHNESPLSVKPVFDIHDPSDAMEDPDRDGVPNIWESILAFSPHLPRSVRGTADGDTDHDSDEVMTHNEVEIGTWPVAAIRKPAHGHGPGRDRDYDELNETSDPIPYVHDEAHVVYYQSKQVRQNFIQDLSTGGDANHGRLVGSVQPANNSLQFAGPDSWIELPAADLGSVSARSVLFHFYATATDGHRVLYQNSAADNGSVIYINDGELWAGTWSSGGSTFIHLGNIVSDQWYAVAMVFDGKRKELSAYLNHNNRWSKRAQESVQQTKTGGIDAHITIGGAPRESKVWNELTSQVESTKGQSFAGYLDYITVYNRKLSDVDVARLSRNDIFPHKQIVFIREGD